MPTTTRTDSRGRPKQVPLPDFGAKVLGTNPEQTVRILGLVRAGSSYDYILEVGRYQGTWTEADVRRVLTANRVPMPPPLSLIHI